MKFNTIIEKQSLEMEFSDSLNQISINKEIVFSGYTSSGDVFAINHDGSNVDGFPASLNEKILKGMKCT